jgi:hypothetical protein
LICETPSRVASSTGNEERDMRNQNEREKEKKRETERQRKREEEEEEEEETHMHEYKCIYICTPFINTSILMI